MTTADPAITVSGLCRSYGSVEAVRGIDIIVQRGEVFAFLGPNGAGKTTTVEILEGYRKRNAGDVSVLGEDPASPGRRWREQVGIVLQESKPDTALTARETVAMYSGYYPNPRGVDETIELVGLSESSGVRAGRLSGGQKRRLDVAIALIGDPDLLFLDEPTTGFDPSARRASWQMISGLRDLGKTIFLTTHYMDEAQALADRVAIIADGEIVAQGTPDQIGGRDHAPSKIVFKLPSELTAASLPPTLVASARESAGSIQIETDDPVAVLHELTGWSIERRVAIDDLEVRRRSLEDVYLLLTDSEGE